MELSARRGRRLAVLALTASLGLAAAPAWSADVPVPDPNAVLGAVTGTANQVLAQVPGLPGTVATTLNPGTDVVQPGASIVTGGYCTLAWILKGGSDYYGLTARHCAPDIGDVVTLATGTEGAAKYRIGQVAFVGDTTDYALVKLDRSILPKVSPALKGHAQYPTGVATTANAKAGDVIQFSGEGVGFHATQATREQRVGVLTCESPTTQGVVGPATFGDSGGPLGDATTGNQAFGIVNTLTDNTNGEGCVVPAAALEGGLTLQGILANAASRGLPLRLVTAGESVS